MARRRKGREIDGWVLIDKTAGPTSTAIVNKTRWLLDARKAGHAGTLDPAATGLLVIALGAATKCVPYVMDADKCYRFTVRWGAATNTDDAEGEVIGTSDHRPTEGEIAAALPAFTGDIVQVPPQYSAIRADGQRAYARARAGEDMDLAGRPLHVARLEAISRPDPDRSVLEMVCGKGGYVRSLARDLGRDLGCLGHVETLHRVWSGPFDVTDALPWRDDVEPATLEAAILPLAHGLKDVPECRCTEVEAARITQGNPGAVLTSETENGGHCWASVSGNPIALGTYKFGYFHPNRVLRQT